MAKKKVHPHLVIPTASADPAAAVPLAIAEETEQPPCCFQTGDIRRIAPAKAGPN